MFIILANFFKNVVAMVSFLFSVIILCLFNLNDTNLVIGIIISAVLCKILFRNNIHTFERIFNQK